MKEEQAERSEHESNGDGASKSWMMVPLLMYLVKIIRIFREQDEFYDEK